MNRNIKILHIISKFDNSEGGPPKSVAAIMQSQNLLGHNSKVVTTSLIKNKIKNVFYGDLLFRRYAIPKLNFLKLIVKEIKKNEIIHIHNFWNVTVTISIILAKIYNKKIILSPHGSLDEKNVSNNYFIKLIYFTLVDQFSLYCISGFHFLNKNEKKNFYFKKFLTKFNVIIPNFILSPKYKSSNLSIFDKHKINFIYLGRLNKIKGVDIQIDSLKKIINKNFDACLHIIGPDGGKLKELQVQAKNLNLETRVFFHKPIFNSKRFLILKKATAVLLSSYSECDPIVAKETLSVGGVLIATKSCGLSSLGEKKVAIVVDRNINQIFKAMKFVIQNPNKIMIIKKNIKKYVKNNFNVKIESKKIISCYNKILNEQFK